MLRLCHFTRIRNGEVTHDRHLRVDVNELRDNGYLRTWLPNREARYGSYSVQPVDMDALYRGEEVTIRWTGGPTTHHYTVRLLDDPVDW